MRIAVFYELNPGGARRAANEFARAMKTWGHVVDLFVVDENADTTLDKYYHSVKCFPFTPVVWTGNNWRARLYRDTVELYRLSRLHKKIAHDIDHGKYDLTFVQPSKFTQAPFLLRYLSTRSVYYCQEPLRLVYDSLFAIPDTLAPTKKLYEQISRAMRKHIDRVNISYAQVLLANSTYTQQNIRRAYGLASSVVHMGVDTSVFYPEQRKKSIDILFIGTRDASEGFGLFTHGLSQMKRKPKVTYLIRGENWISNDKKLREYYSKAKIVICFGFHEPFGLIPIEAMACGCVVAAIDEGGYKDSVRNGKTGILVKKDPQAIAETLDALLSNTKKLDQLSRNAVHDMQLHWSWRKGVEQILQLGSKQTLVRVTSSRA